MTANLLTEAHSLWHVMNADGDIKQLGEGYIAIRHNPKNNNCNLCRFMAIMNLNPQKGEHHADRELLPAQQETEGVAR